MFGPYAQPDWLLADDESFGRGNDSRRESAVERLYRGMWRDSGQFWLVSVRLAVTALTLVHSLTPTSHCHFCVALQTVSIHY